MKNDFLIQAGMGPPGSCQQFGTAHDLVFPKNLWSFTLNENQQNQQKNQFWLIVDIVALVIGGLQGMYL